MEVVHIAIRAKRCGEYVIEFLKSSPDGLWSTSGAGRIRVFRISTMEEYVFTNLGLPEVVKLKRRFFEAAGRYHFIPPSCWTVTVSGASSPTQREFYIG